MKRFIAVVLIGLISVAGCQNDSRQENSQILDQEDHETKSAIATAIQPDDALEDVLPAYEAATIEPANAAEKSAEKPLVSRGQANADVLFVKAELVTDLTWTFTVTVAHPDSGWEDYADGWDVVLPDGTILMPDPDSPYTRLLLHPHESEQPFTRSQAGIRIPPEVEQVTVRAHDLVDGFGGVEVVVDLAAESGADFEVVR